MDPLASRGFFSPGNTTSISNEFLVEGFEVKSSISEELAMLAFEAKSNTYRKLYQESAKLPKGKVKLKHSMSRAELKSAYRVAKWKQRNVKLKTKLNQSERTIKELQNKVNQSEQTINELENLKLSSQDPANLHGSNKPSIEYNALLKQNIEKIKQGVEFQNQFLYLATQLNIAETDKFLFSKVYKCLMINGRSMAEQVAQLEKTMGEI